MRRNKPKRPHGRKEYKQDYIILPDNPEIKEIIVKPMRTVYKNLAAWEHAPFTTVIRSTDDLAMQLIADKI